MLGRARRSIQKKLASGGYVKVFPTRLPKIGSHKRNPRDSSEYGEFVRLDKVKCALIYRLPNGATFSIPVKYGVRKKTREENSRDYKKLKRKLKLQ